MRSTRSGRAARSSARSRVETDRRFGFGYDATLKLVYLAQNEVFFGSFLETECSSLRRRSPEVWGRSLSPNPFELDHVERILNIVDFHAGAWSRRAASGGS